MLQQKNCVAQEITSYVLQGVPIKKSQDCLLHIFINGVHSPDSFESSVDPKHCTIVKIFASKDFAMRRSPN